jgi:hypothetical protein
VRFLITMNMPSYTGNAVHQMHVEHPAKSLDEFIKALSERDFIIVNEFYKARETNVQKSEYENRGEIAIGYRHIGKIKVMQGF